MEEEELLLGAQEPVVTFLGLLDPVLVLLELLGVGEGDGVDPLE